ncbi:MAG: glycolate oxidase subunit GlcE [Betaproteobacteria bacterium HGW-Betaproteobacteria-5]|jgi:glycolate oxidase FAD binding subunit|nr:MAG: glycolate oxidase subunit GlcE [Betaproteobacteria bacterium HGW-Betaproteobacteria-5]PKO40474.1 MAG: glycolate oxidase subunit GlcE [Betaproteobacteria bacterium HGW-Betaproteobacteria-6]
MSLAIQTVSTVQPDSPILQRWQDQIRTARAEEKTLVITGAGSKSFYGLPIEGEALDTRDYRGIIDYEPTELVMTARCGTPLSEIEATLAASGQMLAFEPPRFGGTPTIGGVVAAGLSGPRRMAAGAVRDFVLGVRLMTGTGDLMRFGGQVMKNVAGYDVSRMLTGSLGCFGVVAEVSLKVVPTLHQETTLQFDVTEREALANLNRWAGQPLPISGSLWLDGKLSVRLSGAEPAVAAARRKLGGEALVDNSVAEALWAGVRDQSHSFFAEDSSALIRLSLPDTSAPIPRSEQQLIEWGGAQRWYRADVSQLQQFCDLATNAGGHATLFRAPKGHRTSKAFTPLSKPLLRIHRALKQSFDPAGVFNRGRMYPEF